MRSLLASLPFVALCAKGSPLPCYLFTKTFGALRLELPDLGCSAFLVDAADQSDNNGTTLPRRIAEVTSKGPWASAPSTLTSVGHGFSRISGKSSWPLESLTMWATQLRVVLRRSGKGTGYEAPSKKDLDTAVESAALEASG